MSVLSWKPPCLKCSSVEVLLEALLKLWFLRGWSSTELHMKCYCSSVEVLVCSSVEVLLKLCWSLGLREILDELIKKLCWSSVWSATEALLKCCWSSVCKWAHEYVALLKLWMKLYWSSVMQMRWHHKFHEALLHCRPPFESFPHLKQWLLGTMWCIQCQVG